MIEVIGTAILRKIVFMALLFGGFKVIDNYYLKAFDTDEILKDNPISVAIVVGSFFVALAFA